MRIAQTLIKDLVTDPANTRRHGERNLETIKASLQRFGQQKPIVVDTAGVVVAGNGTLEAARALGWEKIAVVRTGLAGADRVAYGIADNRTAELAEWDDAALAEMMAGLKEEGVPGYTDDEIEALISAAMDPGDVVEDEVPDVPETAVSQTGDLWLLGEHRVLCGDATVADDVGRVMDGDLAQWVWTDPPYGVDYEGKTEAKLRIANDDADGLPALLGTTFGNTDDILAEGAAIYVAHPSGPLSLEFGTAFVGAGWRFHQTLVWVKNTMVLGHSDYHYQHEPILYGWKGKNRKWYGQRTAVTIAQVDRPSRSDEHPTAKPLGLLAIHLGNSSVRGQLGFDPFLGSGTTLIAAEQLDRRCYGIEIEPNYIDVIVNRWQNYTEQAATLDGDGRTFAEIAEARHG